MAGFTTCREMGPTWPYVDVALRNAIDQGAVPGPRLLVAGNYVSSTGGAGDARQFSIYVDVPDRAQPRRSARRDRRRRPHQLQERRRLHQDPRDRRGAVEGHLARARSSTRTRRCARRSSRPTAGAGRSRRTRTAPRASRRDPRRRAHRRSRLVPRRRGGRAAAAARQPQDVLRADALTSARRSHERRGRTCAGVRGRARAPDPGQLRYAGFKRALAAGLPIGFATDAGGDSARRERARAGGAGRIRRDADGGDRLRDEPQRRDHGLVGPRRLGRGGQVRRPGGRCRRSAAGHHRAASGCSS